MSTMVEDLFLLARLDQQRALDRHPVDLLALAVDAVRDARLLAPDRDIRLEADDRTAYLVTGDEIRLRQVLTNLTSNALTHTPPGTSVSITLGPGSPGEAAALVLDVADAGPGLTAEQAERVFERFYRADASRTRRKGGSGLGLAIVASLVAAHGAQSPSPAHPVPVRYSASPCPSPKQTRPRTGPTSSPATLVEPHAVMAIKNEVGAASPVTMTRSGIIPTAGTAGVRCAG